CKHADCFVVRIAVPCGRCMRCWVQDTVRRRLLLFLGYWEKEEIRKRRESAKKGTKHDTKVEPLFVYWAHTTVVSRWLCFPSKREKHLSNPLLFDWKKKFCPMHFSTVPSSDSWQPVLTADSTDAYYWLNWRVLLCAIWVLSSMIIASILIWKFEGTNTETEGSSPESHCRLYEAELWTPCLTEVHPVWLLVFRLIAFAILLAFLIINVVMDGGGIFFYYTQ
ncbi:hypothetical protein BHE74_00002348, partial [Ensete ventricosum]